MTQLENVDTGIYVVFQDTRATHVIADNGRKGQRSRDMRTRTFVVAGCGTLQETIRIAYEWRNAARKFGADRADELVQVDPVRNAQRAVKASASVEHAKEDVARVLARYPVPWDYHGYRNVYGAHTRPGWELVQ